MKFCEECGAKLEDDAKFCEECGAAVEDLAEGPEVEENMSEEGQKDAIDEPLEVFVRFCEECGAKLEAGAKFCEECGTAVEEFMGEPEVAETVYEDAIILQESTPEYVPEVVAEEIQEEIEVQEEEMDTPVRFCEECGAKLEAGAKFCEECGAVVEDFVEELETEETILEVAAEEVLECVPEVGDVNASEEEEIVMQEDVSEEASEDDFEEMQEISTEEELLNEIEPEVEETMPELALNETVEEVDPPVRFCENCGTKMQPGMKFCGECGVALFINKKMDAVISVVSKETQENVIEDIQNETPVKSMPKLKKKHKLGRIVFGIILFVVFIWLVMLGIGFVQGIVGQNETIDNDNTVVDENEVETTVITPSTAPTTRPQFTNTPVPTATATPKPTNTPVPTATATPKPTNTPVPTATATPKPTNTPVPTATATPKPTNTPVPTATATPQPTNTPTPTMTPISTLTAEPEEYYRTTAPEWRDDPKDSVEVKKIKQSLRDGEYSHYCFKDRLAGADLITQMAWLSDPENELLSIRLHSLQTEEWITIDKKYYEVNGDIIQIVKEYIDSLTDGYYGLYYAVYVPELGKRIDHRQTWYVAQNDIYQERKMWLYYPSLEYKENYKSVNAVLSPDSTKVISKLKWSDGSEIDKSLYEILYDGRAIRLSAELLQQCVTTDKWSFWVQSTDGSKADLNISKQ